MGVQRGINPGHELEKIEWHIKRLARVFADPSVIMGDPPDDEMLDLWSGRAEHLAHSLDQIVDQRRQIWLMRATDADRAKRGYPPLYADVPGVIP